ncbi:MAG: cytochrome C [Jaaginema sp. PMC 1079.18]|nr:cytochrome C [Jaaginema sp. PMC 1080.18]MEC4850667.1 cytochrome C [Jaaginema sp. PMC 1079.18]MEC4866495.1 cytochrome C [Jaaginema sp. PMC 1078.18]
MFSKISWRPKVKIAIAFWGIITLIAVWAILLGGGMAKVLAQNPPVTTTDPVPEQYQLGQSLYLEYCSTCHLAIPPAVFPTQTWQELLENRDRHYGVSLPRIIGPELVTMWNYIQVFSRSLGGEDFGIPFRFDDSRYFQALHPDVSFTNSPSVDSCRTCHPGANQFNFREFVGETKAN